MPVLIAEVARKSKDEAASQLAERARILQKAGVHAVCVRTDAEDTATGLSDLFAVVRAVPKMPVLRRDWFIHPLQVCTSSLLCIGSVTVHLIAVPLCERRALMSACLQLVQTFV